MCIILMRLACDIVVVVAMNLKKKLPTEILEIVIKGGELISISKKNGYNIKVAASVV